MSKDWIQYSGKWLVSNGKLTILPHQGLDWPYEWIGINKPEWENFIFSVDVDRPDYNYTDAVAIVIGSEELGVEIDTLSYIYWAFIGESWSYTRPITGNRENGINLVSNIQIEVNNGTYTLRANGREIEVITLSGYVSREIKIGLACDGGSKGCTTFDNVKVTYLP